MARLSLQVLILYFWCQSLNNSHKYTHLLVYFTYTHLTLHSTCHHPMEISHITNLLSISILHISISYQLTLEHTHTHTNQINSISSNLEHSLSSYVSNSCTFARYRFEFILESVSIQRKIVKKKKIGSMLYNKFLALDSDN